MIPALPDAWSDGGFSGMRSRGGYVVDAEWKDGKIQIVNILKDKGENSICVVKFPGAGNAKVKGAKIRKRVTDNEIILNAKIGKPIILQCN